MLRKNLEAEFIFDTTFARDFSLYESQREFVERYKNNSKNLPILSSACPGFICYAEKTHGSFILPYISAVKSPQQIMGSLVKDYLAKKLDVTPDVLYHVSIMPCFDKKLEASRKEFNNEFHQTRDVDCVLSTSMKKNYNLNFRCGIFFLIYEVEIEQMIEEKNFNLLEMEDDHLNSL